MRLSSFRNLFFLGVVALLASLIAGWSLEQEKEEQAAPVVGLTKSRDVLLLTGLLEDQGLGYSFDKGELRAKEWIAARHDLRARQFWSDSPPGDLERRELAAKVEARIDDCLKRVVDKLIAPDWPVAWFVRVELEENPEYTPPSRAAAQFADFPCDPTSGRMRGEFPYRVSRVSLLVLSDQRNLASGSLEHLFKSSVSFDQGRGDTLVVVGMPPSERWAQVETWAREEQERERPPFEGFDFKMMRHRMEQTQIQLNLEVVDGDEIQIELRNSGRRSRFYYDDSLRQGSHDEPRFTSVQLRKNNVPMERFASCHSNSSQALPVELSTLPPGESISRRVRVRDLLPGIGVPDLHDPELEFKVQTTVYLDANLLTYVKSETGWHKIAPASSH